MIQRVASETFGNGSVLVKAVEAERRRRAGTLTGNEVIAFGKGFEEKIGSQKLGGEVGIKAPSDDDDGGTFKIDYLLTQVDGNLQPVSVVAVEVQTIDTTDSYASAAKDYYAGRPYWNGAKPPKP